MRACPWWMRRHVPELAAVEIAHHGSRSAPIAIIDRHLFASIRLVVKIGGDILGAQNIRIRFPLSVIPNQVGFLLIDEFLGLRHEVFSGEMLHRNFPGDLAIHVWREWQGFAAPNSEWPNSLSRR